MNPHNAPYWTRRGARKTRQFIRGLRVPLFIQIALGVILGFMILDKLH